MSCAVIKNIQPACLDIKLHHGNNIKYGFLVEDESGNPIDLQENFDDVELVVKAKNSSVLPAFYRSSLRFENNVVNLPFPKSFFRRAMPKQLYYEIHFKNSNVIKQTWLYGLIQIVR